LIFLKFDEARLDAAGRALGTPGCRESAKDFYSEVSGNQQQQQQHTARQREGTKRG